MKLISFIHNKACTFSVLRLRRKGKKIGFIIKGRTGYEIADKVNKIFKFFKVFTLFLFIAHTAQASPGWEAKKAYLAYQGWYIYKEYSIDKRYQAWSMKIKPPDITAYMKIIIKDNIVIETVGYYSCITSGKHIYDRVNTLPAYDDYWRIQGPCLEPGMKDYIILIAVELNNHQYIVRRKLCKK